MADQTEQPGGGEPRIIDAEAQLFVRDVRESCAFYIDTLGFAKVFDYGDPPFYGQVMRGNARLNLRLVCEPVFVGDIREREQLLSACINVKNIEALFAAYETAGANFHLRLKRQPWGAHNFIVRDPDGNLILFAE